MTKSTKPFRRARDLFLVTIYLWSVNIWLVTCKKVAQLTHSEFIIDPLESPTLHRAHRIIHSRDSATRQTEALQALDALEAAHDSKMEKLEESHAQEMYEKSEKHRIAVEAWDYEYDAPERAARAEQLRLEEIEKEEQRKIENKKIAEYLRKRQQEQESSSSRDQWSRDAKAYLEMHERWEGFTVTVDPNARANIRSMPSSQTSLMRIAQPNEVLYVNGWLYSEELYGNKVWYRVREGGWVWSGVVDPAKFLTLKNQLENLNDNPDFEVIRDWSGTPVRTTQKAFNPEGELYHEIKRLKILIAECVERFKELGDQDPTTIVVDEMNDIVEEHDKLTTQLKFCEEKFTKLMNKAVDDLEQKKNTTFYQTYAPVGKAKKDDLWIDTASDNHQLHKYNGSYWVKMTPEKVAIERFLKKVHAQNEAKPSGMITANMITAGSLSADRIVVGPSGIEGPNVKFEAPKTLDLKDAKISRLERQVEDLLDQKKKLGEQMKINQANSQMQATVNHLIPYL